MNKTEFGEYVEKIVALTEIPLPDPEAAVYISNYEPIKKHQDDAAPNSVRLPSEGWHASAVLERMVWKDNKGKIAKAVTLSATTRAGGRLASSVIHGQRHRSRVRRRKCEVLNRPGFAGGRLV